MHSDEVASKATKAQSAFLENVLKAELAVPAPAFGRKLDLQLRATSVRNTLELNNSEFKKSDTAQPLLDYQFRKNIQVNHAMMLQLNSEINLPLDDKVEVFALDVHGWVAKVFCLRKMDDVYVCDLATDTPILLPYDDETWDDFLTGESIAVLWNYAVSDCSYNKHLFDP